LDCSFVDVRQFEGPPPAGRASKTKVKVVSDRLRTFGRDGIFDTFAKGIDIPVDGVLTNGNNVAGRVAVVGCDVRFEESKFFHMPRGVDDLDGSIALASLSLGSLESLRSTEGICELRGSKDAIGETIDDSIEVGLGKSGQCKA
jgi:hypothetical protein